MSDTIRSGPVTVDKAIARDIEREATGGRSASDAAPPPGEGLDPVERGKQANEAQVRTGEAARMEEAGLDNAAGEAGELAQSSGKTGKAPRGGKDSGADNERGGGPADSRKDTGSA